MNDGARHDRSDALLDLVGAAEVAVAATPNAQATDLDEVRATLDRIERATPGGAALHAQLDTVRKWLAVLAHSTEHARFGGEQHVRNYVLTQLRVVRGAIEDYLRSVPGP